MSSETWKPFSIKTGLLGLGGVLLFGMGALWYAVVPPPRRSAESPSAPDQTSRVEHAVREQSPELADDRSPYVERDQRRPSRQDRLLRWRDSQGVPVAPTPEMFDPALGGPRVPMTESPELVRYKAERKAHYEAELKTLADQREKRLGESEQARAGFEARREEIQARMASVVREGEGEQDPSLQEANAAERHNLAEDLRELEDAELERTRLAEEFDENEKIRALDLNNRLTENEVLDEDVLTDAGSADAAPAVEPPPPNDEPPPPDESDAGP